MAIKPSERTESGRSRLMRARKTGRRQEHPEGSEGLLPERQQMNERIPEG